MFDIKAKKEALQKEYSELANQTARGNARMLRIEGALEILEEQEKEMENIKKGELAKEEIKQNAEKDGNKEVGK
jgi:hypothetical protein